MGTFRMFASAAAAALVCFQAAQAQVTDDARRVLTESAAAIGKVQSMTFHARRYATGPLEGVLNTQGDVKMIRNGPDKNKSTMRMKGKTQEAGRGTRDFDVLVDNGMVTWIDAGSKKVVERQITPKGEGSSEMSIAQQLIIDDLFAPEPYRQQLSNSTPGFKVSVEGTESVGGEVCEVVKASYNEGLREIYIHISAADHLPRKLEYRGNPPKGNTNDKPLSMIVEMTEVKLNPGLKATDLALATPEGYTRDLPKAPSPMPPDNTTPAPAAVAIGLPAGTEAPTFNLKNTKGEPMALANMKGNVVVLAFWGTWNGTWKKASPTVEKIYTSYAGKPVRMIGVACRETDPKGVATRWTDDKMSFPTVIGDEATPTAYQVKGYPTFVIIGGDGKVVDFVQGFAGEEQFTARMTASINRALDAIKK